LHTQTHVSHSYVIGIIAGTMVHFSIGGIPHWQDAQLVCRSVFVSDFSGFDAQPFYGT